MMEKALPWLNRLQRAFTREATFLPKRLVLVTLLLLVIYLVMLLRTDQKIRHTALGFVEANLQSKLVADYEQAAKPSALLAPLRLEILHAKIQDENPAWSEAEIDAALQQALAAAAAPILQATPTPYPTTRMIVQASIVVNNQWVFDTPMPVDRIQPASEQPAPATATVVAPAVAVRWPASAIAASTTAPAVAFAFPMPTNGAPHEQPATSIAPSTATPAVVTLFAPTSAPSLLAPTTVATVEALNPPTISITPLPTANSTPTNVPATHLAASQPSANETTLPIPVMATVELWASTVTATPTTTWTPSPTSTNAAPTTMPTESSVTLPSGATATATVPSPLLATVFPDVSPVSTSGPLLTVTPLPSPTATASPTVTPTPTLLPAISQLTAQATEDKVVIEWEPSTGHVVGYNLYRGESISGAPSERRNDAPLANATYTDSVLLDGKSYFYYVTVVDQQNRESLPSPAVAVTVGDRIPPNTPNLLSLHLSGNQLQIRWQANTEADLAGYRLYRSTSWPVDRSQGPIHDVTLLMTPSYLDQVVLNGQTYYYVFTAVDRAGNESQPSMDAQMPTIDLTAPAAPVGLTATAQTDGIALTWQAPSDSDLAGYRLYRTLTLPIDTTAPPIHSQPLLTTPAYYDETVERNKSYYYVLIAVDSNQNSSLPSAVVMGRVEE